MGESHGDSELLILQQTGCSGELDMVYEEGKEVKDNTKALD